MIAAESTGTTLRQPWLTIARLTWVVLAIVLLAGFFLIQDSRNTEVADLPKEVLMPSGLWICLITI